MNCLEATENKIQPGVFQSPCFQATLFQSVQPTPLCQYLEWSACFHLSRIVHIDQILHCNSKYIILNWYILVCANFSSARIELRTTPGYSSVVWKANHFLLTCSTWTKHYEFTKCAIHVRCWPAGMCTLQVLIDSQLSNNLLILFLKYSTYFSEIYLQMTVAMLLY